MKIISKILTLAFLLFQLSISGQNIGAKDIDEGNVTPWIENDISKYEGIYHFGEGDGSNLIIIINDTTITVQIRQSLYWTEGGYAVEA